MIISVIPIKDTRPCCRSSVELFFKFELICMANFTITFYNYLFKLSLYVDEALECVCQCYCVAIFVILPFVKQRIQNSVVGAMLDFMIMLEYIFGDH